MFGGAESSFELASMSIISTIAMAIDLAVHNNQRNNVGPIIYVCSFVFRHIQTCSKQATFPFCVPAARHIE